MSAPIGIVRTVRIANKHAETPDIASFELVAPDGSSLPPFSAGAHIDVHLPDGLVRQYSLCNNPAETHRYLIAVLRDPNSRGGSIAMHALECGQTVSISDPKNHFPVEHDDGHSVLLAGGIGITPILCMAEELSDAGASFELHYCTRSAARTAFLGRLTASSFAERLHVYHDDRGERPQLDLSSIVADPASNKRLYVCGPAGFIDAVLGAARAAGWAEDRLHREYFAAAPVDTSHDGSFEIQIASSGAVIHVAPGQTALEALTAAGAEVPVSCEQGVCGTCLTRVLEGTPDHRDMYLTPDEQARGDLFTPCCSRAKSARLVLDL